MQVIVLSVPDCPKVGVLNERLEEALAGLADVGVERRVVSDEHQAVALGMHGSPTVLIDGIDPFAPPDTPGSFSCRVYRDEGGRVVDAPSVQALREALSG